MKKLLLLLLFILLTIPSQAQDYFYPGVYSSTNTGFRYTGTWVDNSNTTKAFRFSKSSATVNAGVEWSYFGTGFTIHTRSGAATGGVYVCRDAVCTFHDLTTSENTNATITYSGQTEGFHTARFVVGSVATALWFDYVTILGDALPEMNVNVLNFPANQDVTIADSEASLYVNGVVDVEYLLNPPPRNVEPFVHLHILASGMIAMITAAFGYPWQAAFYLLVMITGASGEYYWWVTFLYIVGAITAYWYRAARK